ncbi:hypothetical protein LSH36_462g02044 [Paralvinella palmiformis]|uniref:Uncharacterized protein n=1 Tax=Paralvinella palmiformis TaxID=53620 RepID=A0AAD9MXM5_9ANNE|nr:hypothetical protein LSH36_462g02044 [Paralvinella palmiformis]
MILSDIETTGDTRTEYRSHTLASSYETTTDPSSPISSTKSEVTETTTDPSSPISSTKSEVTETTPGVTATTQRSDPGRTEFIETKTEELGRLRSESETSTNDAPTSSLELATVRTLADRTARVDDGDKLSPRTTESSSGTEKVYVNASINRRKSKISDGTISRPTIGADPGSQPPDAVQSERGRSCFSNMIILFCISLSAIIMSLATIAVVLGSRFQRPNNQTSIIRTLNELNAFDGSGLHRRYSPKEFSTPIDGSPSERRMAPNPANDGKKKIYSSSCDDIWPTSHEKPQNGATCSRTRVEMKTFGRSSSAPKKGTSLVLNVVDDEAKGDF